MSFFNQKAGSEDKTTVYLQIYNAAVVGGGSVQFLPARASEQGNVIGSVHIYIYIYVCIKKNCN